MTAAEELFLISDVLLGAPETWTQGHYARDAYGHKISYEDPQACQFCLAGFVFAVAGNLNGDTWEYLQRASGLNSRELVKWNDMEGRTAAEVQALFEKAALLAQSEE